MLPRTFTFRLHVVFTVAILLIFSFSCKKKDDSDKKLTPSATCSDGIQNQGETGIDCGGPCASCATSKRDSVIEDYNVNYIGSGVTVSGWTGNASSCDAGTIPASVRDKILQRVNYFRRMVGLNDNITWDSTKFPMYQQAALMMKANNALDHAPSASWLCYTADGAAGASKSNLALGSHTSTSITRFIQDAGSSNTFVGHRRWILFSKSTVFSVGSTDYSMSLGVIGFPKGNTKIPEYIAYPPAGYVPQPLVYGRWSFGISGADFSSATVTMKDGNGGNILLNVLPVLNGYGDNTIVWEPSGIDISNNNDISYKVTISGIGNTPKTSYTYTVTIVKP